MLALLAVLAVAACGSPGSPESDRTGSWEGTITTDGDVTTVVNESGSVWGGEATLVEEASIGVIEGAEELMFGMVTSVVATDERIYALDAQVPVVRAYDHESRYLFDVGRSGEGPGEYTQPADVAVGDSGRLFVFDGGLNRINVYDRSGEPLENWPLQGARCCVWPIYALGEDSVWAPIQGWPDSEDGEQSFDDRRFGAQAVGPEGRYGEILWVPEIAYERATYALPSGYETETPFSPRIVWNPTPQGGMVAGASDRYRFELLRPDGSRTVIERFWEPVPIPPEHREWERLLRIAQRRRQNPDWNWDGAEIPVVKPAYGSFIPALSGEIWVVRQGASEPVADCAEDPVESGYQQAMMSRCWVDEFIADVFDSDGRYLGPVPLPEELWVPGATIVHVRDELVLMVEQDAQGTFRVKRYRMEVPREDERVDE